MCPGVTAGYRAVVPNGADVPTDTGPWFVVMIRVGFASGATERGRDGVGGGRGREITVPGRPPTVVTRKRCRLLRDNADSVLLIRKSARTAAVAAAAPKRSRLVFSSSIRLHDVTRRRRKAPEAFRRSPASARAAEGILARIAGV